MKYVVQSGDTLWSIAKAQYGNPLLWSHLYRDNFQTIQKVQKQKGRRRLTGPDWIYPGTELQIN